MSVPEGGIHIRPEYDPLGQDERMVRYKLPRVLAYVRNNRIDRVAFGLPRPTRLGIVTSGKAYLDCIAALHQLGIDDPKARAMGIGLYKIGMVWPLEPDGLKAFASDCDELLFVEEKRPLVEDQAKGILYGEERRSRIVGKFNVDGAPLLPSDRPLEAAMVAAAATTVDRGRRDVNIEIDSSLTLKTRSAIQRRVCTHQLNLEIADVRPEASVLDAQMAQPRQPLDPSGVSRTLFGLKMTTNPHVHPFTTEMYGQTGYRDSIAMGR
jgi:TPP-dependent indolepyruvate ferredoxin oxidoreductase alpha subunit